MSFPKQPQQIEKDRLALAPYNFVELPDQVAKVVDGNQAADKRKRAAHEALPDQNVFHTSRHSGWIDCRLITESPVYVRAALTPEQAGKRMQAKELSAFFFTIDKDEPVIPGSTLRGMLRGIIEIASFAKITEVSQSRLVYRAVGEGDKTIHGRNYRNQVMRDEGNHHYVPKFHAGYMHCDDNKDWFIWPARNIGGTTFARIRINDGLFRKLHPVNGCHNAFKIYVRVGKYDFHEVKGGFLHIKSAQVTEASEVPKYGFEEATLAKSGPMFSKRSEAVVFASDTDAKWLALDDEQIDAYRDQISQEQGKLLGNDKNDRLGVLRHGQPVFYTLTDDGKVDFFGHCRMLRLRYPNNPLDYVPERLRRESDIDLAEAIFGFTKRLPERDFSKKERRYAGRVSVGDARLISDKSDIWLAPGRPITPKILASPKPTTFQHYLVQQTPNRSIIGKTVDGKPKYEVKLSDYSSSTVIRGHKFYWHKGAATLNDIESSEKLNPTQATRIQPLRAGVEFEFRLRFENLSNEELGALLWVLQLGASEKHRLKLGMGKPLGMGAVKVVPTLRLIDRAARYGNLFDADKWDAGLKSEEENRRVQQDAVAAFERFVLDKIEVPGVRRIEELDRIRQLRAMLSWPGPSPMQTRYLEIERPDPSAKRGKRNEYDGRPVLPNPLIVVGEVKAKERERSAEPSRPRTAPTVALPEGFKRGTVAKWGLGPKASYGFIQPDGGGAQVFVHLNALPPNRTSLQIYERVIYREIKRPNGLEAVEVGMEE